jgi:ketol-acid reductoisomerase
MLTARWGTDSRGMRMPTIHYEDDADLGELDGLSLALLGYGNQGRSWALNLRDSGCDPIICVRADETRDRAVADGFEPAGLDAASDVDVLCILVPDDAIPELDLTRPETGLSIVASGYTLAFDRFRPNGDVGMVAPRMLGPEVRSCYEEGVGFITAVGVQEDRTGHAWGRTLAVAKAIGGLRQGAIELTPREEAILDLAVEQVLSPALTYINGAFVQLMMEQQIPLEAIMTELMLSGEIERNYRLLRENGFVAQLDHHSPTSQYGQLSRRGRFDHLDVLPAMREICDEIADGRFADEWEGERAEGHPTLGRLRDEHAGPGIREFENELRSRLGSHAPRTATKND